VANVDPLYSVDDRFDVLMCVCLCQDAFSLLAYSDPASSPVSYQLNPVQREPVCTALNSAILGRPIFSLPCCLSSLTVWCRAGIKGPMQAGEYCTLDSFVDYDTIHIICLFTSYTSSPVPFYSLFTYLPLPLRTDLLCFQAGGHTRKR